MALAPVRFVVWDVGPARLVRQARAAVGGGLPRILGSVGSETL